jgi:hypothetical protein
MFTALLPERPIHTKTADTISIVLGSKPADLPFQT